MKQGLNGVTENTPKNIVLGAGTVHKGLKYTESSGWNFEASCFGATKGGNKLTITPEIQYIEVDGVNVAMKGMARKVGEKATLELNCTEVTKANIASAIFANAGTSADSNYDVLESKASIDDDDYEDNIAFVGLNGDGDNIIVILDNALCTSGFELDGKNKENNAVKYVYECHAELGSDGDKLPYHIYTPKA